MNAIVDLLVILQSAPRVPTVKGPVMILDAQRTRDIDAAIALLDAQMAGNNFGGTYGFDEGLANITTSRQGMDSGVSVTRSDDGAILSVEINGETVLTAPVAAVVSVNPETARDLGRTIDERDAAEEALSEMFQLVTGREAEWSSAWGYSDALCEVEEHMASLISLTAPVDPDDGIQRGNTDLEQPADIRQIWERR